MYMICIALVHCYSAMCRICNALATGIWEDAAFANYVSIVEHGNIRMVGWLDGLEGLCSLLFAVPFGTLADRWRRDRVLRIASCIQLGAPGGTLSTPVSWRGSHGVSSNAVVPAVPASMHPVKHHLRCSQA